MADTGAPFNLPYPTSGVAADVPFWNQQLAQTAHNLFSDIASPPYVLVKRAAAAHAIPANVFSKVGLDTISESSGASADRPTINAATAEVTLVDAGLYVITARVQVSGGRFDCRIMHGTNEVATLYNSGGFIGSGGVGTLSAVILATAGSKVTLEAYPYAASTVAPGGSDMRIARLGR